MSCVPMETATFAVGPKDYLAHFLHLISTLRQGESRYVALLEGKIRDTLPTMASSFGLKLPAAPLDQMLTHKESSVSSKSSPYNSPSLLTAMPRWVGLPVPTTSPPISEPSTLSLQSHPDLVRGPVHKRLHVGDGGSRIFS